MQLSKYQSIQNNRRMNSELSLARSIVYLDFLKFRLSIHYLSFLIKEFEVASTFCTPHLYLTLLHLASLTTIQVLYRVR